MSDHSWGDIKVHFPSETPLKLRDKIFIELRIKKILKDDRFWYHDYKELFDFLSKKINIRELSHAIDNARDRIEKKNDGISIGGYDDCYDDDEFCNNENIDKKLSSKIDDDDLKFYLKTLDSIEYKKMPNQVYKEFINIISDDLELNIKSNFPTSQKSKSKFINMHGYIIAFFVLVFFGGFMCGVIGLNELKTNEINRPFSIEKPDLNRNGLSNNKIQPDSEKSTIKKPIPEREYVLPKKEQ